MKMVKADQLQSGDTLAKTIYNETGKVLVGLGVSLTSGMIRRLQDTDITSVYIKDSRIEDVESKDSVSEETRQRAIRTVYETYSQMMEAKKWNRTFAISKIGTNFRQTFEDILRDLQNKEHLMLHLSGIYSKSNYLYGHSVNVGIYAAALGMAVGLDRNQLIDLGIGAMLHDIGKTQIPSEIINKPSRLTAEEFEIMKQHTTIGYDILRNQRDVPLISAHCALQHHERIDGSGYPRGLSGEKIHLYARITAIVDTYDALVSNRVYRKAFLPHEALEILYSSAHQYDIELMNLFRNHVVIYPVGMVVRLSTGVRGVVVDINSKHPHRPIIRVMRDPSGELVRPYEIDLSSQLSIMITGCNETI